MTAKRRTVIPSAAERAAEEMRASRAAGGYDQGALAEVLSSFGAETNLSTVTRIETGRQLLTLEQALIVGLVMPDGLRSLLRPPFKLGSLTIRDEADLDSLLAGRHVDENGVSIETRLDREVTPLTNEALGADRDRRIAETLGTTPRRIAMKAEALYGRSADREIAARFSARLDELDPRPAQESAAWRAHRAHAVRAVTKEIELHLR